MSTTERLIDHAMQHRRENPHATLPDADLRDELRRAKEEGDFARAEELLREMERRDRIRNLHRE